MNLSPILRTSTVNTLFRNLINCVNNFTAINEPGPNQVLQKKNEQEMSKKVFIYIYISKV